ncbi:hypothetical protein EDD85DRAFT_776109, partial [Armillaria nabsnona]
IERLWQDVTLGFGGKWKGFFAKLEQYDGLNPKMDAHIWLLHHLFLNAINDDALAWAESWNYHPLTVQHQTTHSPTDFFIFGMMEKGIRGLDDIMNAGVDDDTDLLSQEDLDSFGIDWEAYNHQATCSHHDENNARDSDDAFDPFATHRPEHYSHVDIDTLGELCPLTDEQVAQLDYYTNRDMESHGMVWISAVQICNQLLNNIN